MAAGATGGPPRRWLPIVGPSLGIVGLVLFNAAMDAMRPDGPGAFGPGGFLHVAWTSSGPVGHLIDVLNLGSAVVILATGMALVIATRGVDLSVGAIAAVAGATAAALTTHGHSPIVVIAAALAVAAVCGLWNGVLISLLR